MERLSNTGTENGLRLEAATLDGWEAWDAVPRDGPAVFVVDTTAFDHGIVRGRWLDVGAGRDQLHAELTELLGRPPEAGSWAIIDQVGLGELMASETMSITNLTTVAEDLAAESRQ